MSRLSSTDRNRATFATIAHLVLLLGIVGFGAYGRFINVPETISGGVRDLIINMFTGIRLHMLPWWNLTDWLRQNFFKSVLSTIHGLPDTMFYYPVVQIYSLFGVPLTEWNLFAAKAFLSVVTVLVIYCLAASLFNKWAGLVSAALLALSPTHVAFSTHPDIVTFFVFLQVSSVLAYFWYLRRRAWWTAIPAAVLLGVQAGSENLYYAAIFIVLHFCYVHEGRKSFGDNLVTFSRRFFSWSNLLVWSPYLLMSVVNVYVYMRIGYQQDLTLLGHVLRFTPAGGEPAGLPLGQLAARAYPIFDQLFNMVWKGYPTYSAAFFAAMALSLGHAWRLNLRGFVWWWSIIVTALILYTGSKQDPSRSVHLLVPSILLISSTVSDGLRSIGRRLGVKSLAWEAWAHGLLVAALAFALAPGVLSVKLSRQSALPQLKSREYRGMKAAGAVLRTLGNPKMNVFVLTTEDRPMASSQYYFGLSSSNSDYETNQLFYHEPAYAPKGGVLEPVRLIAAYGMKDFDFYVEFVREPPYPQKPMVLARLKARGARLVAGIYNGPEESEPEVRIYSPHAIPFRRYLIDEQEDIFDRQYANVENLFYNVNVFTHYYFGPHWEVERQK
ncbi:MAG: glycosyltransferase family 39 protein [bacterium]|nr:glycosyltransferase family 39 protein [bacterium]